MRRENNGNMKGVLSFFVDDMYCKVSNPPLQCNLCDIRSFVDNEFRFGKPPSQLCFRWHQRY